MLEKKVIVYLDTGASREHLILAKDDDDYAEQVNDSVDALRGNPRGILWLTTPLCLYLYKVQNIVAIEFLDPPPQDKKLPIGYRPPLKID